MDDVDMSTETELTCGNCPHVKVDFAMGMPVVGCSLDGKLIPHASNMSKQEITFWRIPTSCKRNDDGVSKSESKAPKRDWIIKGFTELERDKND